MVGEAGIEPTTPGLEGRCSIRLSYSPAFLHCSFESSLMAGVSLHGRISRPGGGAITAVKSEIHSVSRDLASLSVWPQAAK